MFEDAINNTIGKIPSIPQLDLPEIPKVEYPEIPLIPYPEPKKEEPKKRKDKRKYLCQGGGPLSSLISCLMVVKVELTQVRE